MGRRNFSPKRIPERLIACLEWSAVQQIAPYDIVSEETFFNNVYGHKLQETLIPSWMNVEDALSKRGIECTDTNLFRYLVKPVLNTILDYTQQSLVAKQSNLLANLHDWEEKMFQKSSNMLLHRGNGLVIYIYIYIYIYMYIRCIHQYIVG